MADAKVNGENFLGSISAREEPNVCSCPLAHEFNFEESVLQDWGTGSFPPEHGLLCVLCFNTITGMLV